MVKRLKVANVTSGLSADVAGIKVGDIIEKYNDVELISK